MFDKIKEFTMDQVEKRMKEIRSLDLDTIENLEELNEEVDALEARKKELKDSIDVKKELRNKIASGQVNSVAIEKPVEERQMSLTKENVLSSKEYRAAWTKQKLGIELNSEERSAISMANVEGAIPTDLQDEILTKVKEYCPVINDVTLLNVGGNIRFAVEGTVDAASIHTQNASITAASDSVTYVDLSSFELTKLIEISASVKSMTIPAFEKWIVSQLVEAISMLIESLIFNGTGSGQPKGVNKISWTNENSVTVEKDEALTTQNILDFFALLKEGYAKKAKVYMSRNTLFSDCLSLQDKAKNDLVTREGSTYYLLGVEIRLTSSIAKHEILMGDMSKYIANMPESLSVKTDFDINTNSYKYLGVAQFDGKPAIEEAFVKINKAVA